MDYGKIAGRAFESNRAEYQERCNEVLHRHDQEAQLGASPQYDQDEQMEHNVLPCLVSDYTRTFRYEIERGFEPLRCRICLAIVEGFRDCDFRVFIEQPCKVQMESGVLACAIMIRLLKEKNHSSGTKHSNVTLK